MFALTIILLFICSSAAAQQDSALIEYPDKTKGSYTLNVFKTFMGPQTNPDDVSSPEKVKKWWEKECDNMLQNTLGPDQALRIIVDQHHQWVNKSFSRWAKVVDLSEYDKLPHLNDDMPTAQHWRKVISCMIALSAIHEIAETPNASQILNKFIRKTIPGSPHLNGKIAFLDGFPENFQDERIDTMLFIVNQTVRYTKVQLMAIFCDQLIFSISTFLAGIYYGRLIYPVTLNFKNSHKWGAHQDEIIGLPNLLHHDFFLHGYGLMTAEQSGNALFAQRDGQPFLQSWAQDSINQLFKTVENPRAHINVVKDFSPTRECVSFVVSQVAVLYHGFHEVPLEILNPRYLSLPIVTADPDLTSFNEWVFKDGIQGINTSVAHYYASMPMPKLLKHQKRKLTKACLKAYLDIDKDRCTLAHMLRMFQVIRCKIMSQHHSTSYCSESVQDIPTLTLLSSGTMSCVLCNSLVAVLLHDNDINITLMVPHPELLTNLTEHEARIVLQSMRQVAHDFAKRSQSISLEKNRMPFDASSTFFNKLLKNMAHQECVESYLAYSDGSPSPITHGMLFSVFPNFTMHGLSSAPSFEKLWRLNIKAVAHDTFSPDTLFAQMWPSFQDVISKQFPAFPNLAKQNSYNPPSKLQGKVQRDWYQCLGLFIVRSMLSYYNFCTPLTNSILETLRSVWQKRPGEMRKLDFLQNFPKGFLTDNLQNALSIINQITNLGLDVRAASTPSALIPQNLAVPLSSFVAALHEGIVLVPMPQYFDENHLWSRHNDQYHSLMDILVQREIIDNLGNVLHNEHSAQVQQPEHNKPYLQHLVQERVATIAKDICEQKGVLYRHSQHLSPQQASTHVILAEFLKLYQDTAFLPKTDGVPVGLAADDHAMIMCQSVFGPLLGDKSCDQERVDFIKGYLNAHQAEV